MVIAIQEGVLGCGIVGRRREGTRSAEASAGCLAIDGSEGTYNRFELLLANLVQGQN